MNWQPIVIRATAAATKMGNLEVCKLLLSYGANPNLQDEAGWTPLMIAVSLGSTKNVQALLKAGTNANLRDRKGLTALDIAQQNKHGHIAKILRAHLSKS